MKHTIPQSSKSSQRRVPKWSGPPAGMWMECSVIQALGMGNSAVAPPPNPAPLLSTW